MRGLALGVGLLLWLAGAGCISMKNAKPPELSLGAVGIQDATLTDATFVFSLQVFNPNSFSVRVNNLTYQLRVNGRDLFSGELKKSVRLPANDKMSVDIPVRVRYLDLYNSITDMLRTGSSPFQLKGEVRAGPFTIPYHYGGTLKLPSPPTGQAPR